jgi:hypothetical protein
VRIVVLGCVAVVIAGVALVVVLRLVRRLRTPDKISLITRSFERKGK